VATNDLMLRPVFVETLMWPNSASILDITFNVCQRMQDAAGSNDMNANNYQPTQINVT